jgi:hypothetical protein
VINTKGDWQILRGALGGFAICTLLSVILVLATNNFWRQMNSEYKAHYARFREITRKYLAVDDEERIIRDEYPTFVALYRRGVIGQERRLSWVEALHNGATTVGLPRLDYKLDAQVPFAPQFAFDTGKFETSASDMHLTLDLLHEGDLTGLVNYLDEHAPGLYSVEQCLLTRKNTSSKSSAVVSNLRAECLLRWYTLDLRGNTKIQL